MLEKIGTKGFETLSRSDSTVLAYLDQVLETNKEPSVYEIGVGVGATTLPMAQKMKNMGEIYLFSRDKDVGELTDDLAELGFSNVCSDWGSPTKMYSGYHFELARGFVDDLLPHFDLAYIDGGHVFHLDGSATCILKELCKPDGFMIFDDWNWSLGKSPTLNPQQRPETSKEYDAKQIEMPHVQLVCKALMDTDQRFEFIERAGNTVVYKRKV